MKVLVTGGTGFIGSALVKSLAKQGHEITVLSRNTHLIEKQCGPGIHELSSLNFLSPETSYHIVINLAGAPIFGARWSESRKQVIRDSRIKLTEELVDCIGKMKTKPELLISGSAIGYYGSQGDTCLTEKSMANPDFSHQLCADWEAAAKRAEAFGVRVCLVRTGLVIAEGGGLLQRMLLPFKFCLGGRLGNGRQWMSWIHRQDWIAIAETMITDSSMHGAYNLTAPNPVTNSEFTQTLSSCLKRPAIFPVPAWLLKGLLGEMSELVLGSQRVLPERLLSQGFKFKFSDLNQALIQSLSPNTE